MIFLSLARICPSTYTRTLTHAQTKNTSHTHNVQSLCSRSHVKNMSMSMSMNMNMNLNMNMNMSTTTKTMAAQVLTKADPSSWAMSFQQIRKPTPGPGEVLVKVRACGVCHTDLHVMKSEVAFPIPAVMGHEISGTIESLGPGVSNISSQELAVGQRVVCPFIMPCGTCYHCVRGSEDICETFFAQNRLKGTLYDGTTRLFSTSGSPIAMYSMGGLAEYSVVPATAVFPIRDNNVPLPDAAIIGCAIFTAYGAVRHAADLRAGENVAVVGTGGVGVNVLQFARAFGANKVIAVDVSDEKLAAMKQFGATHLINAQKVASVPDAIKSITGGRGVDVCIEALGRADTFVQTVQSVQDGGRAVMVGIAPAGVVAPVEITRLVRRRIRVIGSYGGKARHDIPDILEHVSRGSVRVFEAISKRYALKDADQAYQDLNKRLITGRAIIDMEL